MINVSGFKPEESVNLKEFQKLEFQEDPQMSRYLGLKAYLQNRCKRSYLEVSCRQSSKILQEIISLKKSKSVFRDMKFKADDCSLYSGCPRNEIKGLKERWEGIQWKSIQKQFPNRKIFSQIIGPNDIEQRILNDCYFLAGISSLAEQPKRIKDLFILQQTNDLHCFVIRILYQGHWKRIIIDDMLPFVGDETVFSKSRNDSLWVILLEKAWAKLYGSYYNIEGGIGEQTLHSLTGAPVITWCIKEDKPTDIWSSILTASQKNYPMVGVTYMPIKEVLGLKQMHAFSVIDAKQIVINGTVKKVMKLRDPYKKTQWTGQWGKDDDKSWNQIKKAQLNVKQKIFFEPNWEQGYFFLNFDHFLSEFNSVSYAQVLDDYYYSCSSPEKFNSQQNLAYYLIHANQDGSYTINIQKPSLRNLSEGQEKKLPEVSVKLIEIRNPQNQILQNDSQDPYRLLSVKKQLNKGVYLLKLKAFFKEVVIQDYQITVGVYSEHLSTIDNLQRKYDHLYKELSDKDKDEQDIQSYIKQGLIMLHYKLQQNSQKYRQKALEWTMKAINDELIMKAIDHEWIKKAIDHESIESRKRENLIKNDEKKIFKMVLEDPESIESNYLDRQKRIICQILKREVEKESKFENKFETWRQTNDTNSEQLNQKRQEEALHDGKKYQIVIEKPKEKQQDKASPTQGQSQKEKPCQKQKVGYQRSIDQVQEINSLNNEEMDQNEEMEESADFEQIRQKEISNVNQNKNSQISEKISENINESRDYCSEIIKTNKKQEQQNLVKNILMIPQVEPSRRQRADTEIDFNISNNSENHEKTEMDENLQSQKFQACRQTQSQKNCPKEKKISAQQEDTYCQNPEKQKVNLVMKKNKYKKTQQKSNKTEKFVVIDKKGRQKSYELTVNTQSTTKIPNRQSQRVEGSLIQFKKEEKRTELIQYTDKIKTKKEIKTNKSENRVFIGNNGHKNRHSITEVQTFIQQDIDSDQEQEELNLKIQELEEGKFPFSFQIQ